MTLFPDAIPEVDFFVPGGVTIATSGSKTQGRRKDGSVFYRPASRHQQPWQQSVACAFVEQYPEFGLLTGGLFMRVDVSLARPKGHYGKRGLLPSAPAYPTSKPDVLKLGRAVEDALKAIAYRDDSQNVDVWSTKRFGEPCGVRVRIWRLE